MEFNNHIPDPPLDQYIESIFHFRNFMPDHSRERVVPTGHLFLIFELDGMPRHTFDNKTLKPAETFTNAWISGQQTGCITISALRNSEMLVIQFKPHGAFPFLHVPLYRLNNRIVPAEKIAGKEILNLRERLLSKENPCDKFEIAVSWLNARLDHTKDPPQTLLTALEYLHREPVSNLSVIVENYPNSRKHMIGQFKRYVGLTPKVYQRILRFNEILLKLNDKKLVTWAEIAYRCGYSDQSHFIKEFSHFSGFNPQEFIDRNFSDGGFNFFPLDRTN